MSDLSKRICRYYTKELEGQTEKTVYDLFDWEKRDVVIKDYKSGRILTELYGLEFPTHYSHSASDIIASKYFRKAGVPQPDGGTGHETSLRQVIHRMVAFWIASLLDEGMIEEGEQSEILYDELAYTLLNQMWAPNSPQWFNTGLNLAYGIKGGNSNLFYYDEEQGKVVASPDTYTRTQASACFIISIEDKLLGPHSISEAYVTETKLFKGGSGTGTNFSTIRAEGEALSGGGQSSGLMSFLRGLDRNAGAIKSGGTTRRAAKMVCLDIDHPEIESFVKWKALEEDKVIALAKMGYDGDIDGEAYATVSGQNSNNSIRIDDEFMKKVDNLARNPQATHKLVGRLDPSVNREILVQSLWDDICQSSWRCADPAPQFTDTFNAWHTCPAGEDGQIGAHHNRLNSTNPCGEYAFLDNTSCNLASINIYSLLDEEADHFDLEGYLHLIDLVQLVLEASIHWGQFPTEEIARKTWIYRATGLGLSNLASLLMSQGLPYDSDAARNLAAALSGILTGESYYISALMAAKLGAFSAYDLNQEHMLRVIRNHSRAAGVRRDHPEGIHYNLPIVDHQLLQDLGYGDLAKALQVVWQAAEKEGMASGYRNAQVTVMAPTGTISFAMDCASTSIEPFFSHVSYKKLVGGSFMKLVNPMLEQGLKKLGYSADERKQITDYIMQEDEHGMVLDGKIEGAPGLREEDLPVFDTANQCGSGKRYIHYLGHVHMVAAISPLISGAISKTVNLPNEATEHDFSSVMIEAWKLGVKGITLYRDGSKFAQPLNIKLSPSEKETMPLEDLNYHDLLERAKKNEELLLKYQARASKPVRQRIKPHGIRTGTTHPAQIEDIKVYITVNRDENDKITEIFMTTDREGTLITGLLNSLSKTISVMLQYDIPTEQISKMLRGQKFEPYGFVQRHPNIKYCTSVSDLISKVLDIEGGDFSRVQVKPTVEELEANHGLRYARTAADNNGEVSRPSYGQIGVDEYVHEKAKEAAQNGTRLYDGSTCSNCSGTRMVTNGTCKVCLDCGETTGCS
ncbi:MAG: vitamin B12-dependent ribonucleotide reductase [Clostridiaceae bacterium]|nr:vitamin B12-dependent ribonucleotide reductase [Clostridiaceae bacterium]